MVRQSGRHESDNQQGRKFCDAYVQSSSTIAGVAGGRCQVYPCSGCVDFESGWRPECPCTEIAGQCASGIATVDSFEGVDDAAYPWHDPAESKNKQGSKWD